MVLYGRVDYDADKSLYIADSCWIATNAFLLAFIIYIIIAYLIPLRIKSPYILLFYFWIIVLLVA